MVGTVGAATGAGGIVGTGVPAAALGVVAGVGATPGVVPSAGNGVPALPGSGVPKLVVGKGFSGSLVRRPLSLTEGPDAAVKNAAQWRDGQALGRGFGPRPES